MLLVCTIAITTLRLRIRNFWLVDAGGEYEYYTSDITRLSRSVKGFTNRKRSFTIFV